MRRRRHLAPAAAAAAALFTASQGQLTWAAAPALAGRGASQAQPWTGEASRARLMMRRDGNLMQAGLSQDMQAVPSIKFEDDDSKFLAPESRRNITSYFAVLRAFSLLLNIFALGAPAMAFIYAVLPWVKRRNPIGRRIVDRAIILWSKLAVKPFFRVTLKGKENLLPEDQAVVYVANHQSFMDILSSFHIDQPFKFVSKASILKIPVIGAAMKAANTITIEREDRRSQLNAFRQCVETLKAGTSIFVFPEGTRSPTGALIDFKKGPFSMARKAGVPIVPVTIKGTNAVMPSKKEYFLFPSKAGVEVIVHAPVSAKDVQEMDEEDLVSSVKRTIDSALPKPLRTASVA